MSNVSFFRSSVAPLAYHLADQHLFAQDAPQPAYQNRPQVHCLAGFSVPALPLLQEAAPAPAEHLALLLHRFNVFLRALHNPTGRRAIGLYVTAQPDRSLLGSAVSISLLCRVAAEREIMAIADASHLALQMRQIFPGEGLFNYGAPQQMNEADLRHVTLQDAPDTDIQIVELHKFEDCLVTEARTHPFIPAGAGLDYIPHPFWSDTRLDPWLSLIETLAIQRTPTLIAIVLEPTPLIEHEAIATLAQQYRLIVEEGSRRTDLLESAARIADSAEQPRSLLESLNLARFYKANRLNDYLVARARRGSHVYEQLLAWQDQLFTMRISLAARGPLAPALIEAMRAALSSPLPNDAHSTLGWIRPVATAPQDWQQRASALQNMRWLGHIFWDTPAAHPKLHRVRHLATAQEAVGLFHLPMMPLTTRTSAFSMADAPFAIPPEVLKRDRFKADEPLLSAGYLYQRGVWLSPENDKAGGVEVEFKLPRDDLQKPALVVGAPGSGKTNLALHLLTQLWRNHHMPFLVLDPSTGQEFRYLYGEPSLRDDLVLFTLGDESGLPFRFNPFRIPYGVTVRAHITRLLACFKAAYEMWDPLPAIYEAALARVYTRPPYSWKLDDKGDSRPGPCLADFAQAIVDELEEHVLDDYGRGTEASGVLTGSSKIRVNGILRSIGYILNVREDDPDFFQRLLTRPAVIEMGTLGDPSNIALVMSFLVIQLVGHIEHAASRRRSEKSMHLLVIEEAHRLLSAETAASASPHQGNTRGKSADEINNLLAEMRKFRQGIMILDQRPSSLVGGVLDNAAINILCRLNDRAGFDHLSNVLNLGPDHQRYARTRLTPGDAIMLDSASGQPVLTRAPLLVDKLQAKVPGGSKLIELLERNARRHHLVPPAADAVANRSAMEIIWTLLSEVFDEKFADSIRQDLALPEDKRWDALRQRLAPWRKMHQRDINAFLDAAALAYSMGGAASVDIKALIDAFRGAP